MVPETALPRPLQLGSKRSNVKAPAARINSESLREPRFLRGRSPLRIRATVRRADPSSLTYDAFTLFLPFLSVRLRVQFLESPRNLLLALTPAPPSFADSLVI